MTTIKFKEHPKAAAHIVINDNIMKLISYSTPVITVNDGWLTVHGLYSMTTRKHIGWFMKNLGLHYYTAKTLYDNNLTLNIYTGEVRDLGE